MVDGFDNPKIPRLICGGVGGGEDSNDDRLSNLPEPIIHHILSLMETIDVVRASAVSRKWRYLWLSIPYLSFNIHNIWSNPQERWSLQKINEKFKDFVNWVLLLQNGSVNIQRFHLSCLNYVDDHTLHRWITAVAQRNVQVLDLNIISDEPIKLPLCLVTCKSLEALKLDFGQQVACFGHWRHLMVPTCVGFGRLKSLDLKYVEILDHILFPKLISCSPLLENLIMDLCSFRGFEILDISSTSLKILTLNHIEFVGPTGDEFSNHKVRIACPNLVSFNFLAPFSPDFTLEGLNSLQNAFIFLYEIVKHARVKESCHLLSKILNGICEAKVMKLSVAFLEFLYLVLEERVYFSASFNNLKSIILCVTMAEWNVPSIISLLNCSPNLEALTIYFDWEEYYNYWKISNKDISCLTYHLKTVELNDFSGHRNELEMVRFLLKNGHVLQKMSIVWLAGVKNCRGIISRIRKFPRSSSSVALKFIEPKPDLYFLEFLR